QTNQNVATMRSKDQPPTACHGSTTFYQVGANGRARTIWLLPRPTVQFATATEQHRARSGWSASNANGAAANGSAATSCHIVSTAAPVAATALKARSVLPVMATLSVSTLASK